MAPTLALLLVGHWLGDMPLQKNLPYISRNKKKFGKEWVGAGAMLLHGVIHGLCAAGALLLSDYSWVVFPALLVGVTHLHFDIAKTIFKPTKPLGDYIDQGAHLGILVLAAWLVTR